MENPRVLNRIPLMKSHRNLKRVLRFTPWFGLALGFFLFFTLSLGLLFYGRYTSPKSGHGGPAQAIALLTSIPGDILVRALGLERLYRVLSSDYWSLFIAALFNGMIGAMLFGILSLFLPKQRTDE